MFCTTSALDVFQEMPISASVEKTLWNHYNPLSSLESGPIEFFIPGSASDYIDLSKTFLQLRVKVTKANGAVVPDPAILSTANLFLHSLFKKVDISLNDTLVTDSSDYAYKAYLQTLVNYGNEFKDTQGRVQMYLKDADTSIAGMVGSVNSGFSRRKDLIAKSASVELFGRLQCDIFSSDRYLLNNVNMRLSLTRNKDTFALICTDAGADYKVVFESAILYVRKVRVASSILIAQAQVLQEGTVANYPINQTVLKTYAVPKGASLITQDNVFLNRIPTRLLLTMTASKGFLGDYTLNPYTFPHYSVNYLALYLDGEAIPTKPFTPDYPNKLYTREYLSTFAAINLLSRDKGFGLSYSEFKLGNCIYGFDLTRDETAGSAAFELARTGTLGFHIKLATPLPENVTVIVLAEFESVISVDKNRSVSFHPSS